MISNKGIALVKQYEGLKLKAYKCSAGVWTIGYGTTIYEDGSKVKEGDVITKERAEILLAKDLERRWFAIRNQFAKVRINQNQIDAILSFTYNLGIGALNGSTLLKKIKLNPDDPTIRDEFNKWVNAKGKRSNGLVKRRAAEADLYFLKA